MKLIFTSLMSAGVGAFLVILFCDSGGWPFTEVAKANRQRKRELRSRAALLISLGYPQNKALERAEQDMLAEAITARQELVLNG